MTVPISDYPTDGLITRQMVERRLGDDFEGTVQAYALMDEAIADASDQAKAYGSKHWTTSNVPHAAQRIIAVAVARYLRNPDGFVRSTAADETVEWQANQTSGEVYFTDEQKARLAALAADGVSVTPANTIRSVGLYAWSDRPRRRHYRDVEAWYGPDEWPDH